MSDRYSQLKQKTYLILLKYAQWFNVVDSFDTHARVPEHFANVDKAASESGHVGIISVGWDPGMFSLNRLYANAILTNGKDYTFWGKGVSQGHSDAIRRIDGVKDGKQYTIPVEAALEAVRNGENPECIRVQYDSITFPKENKGKLIYFQQKIRRYFTMWMKKTAGIAGNVWKRWDFLLVLK